MYRRWKDLWLNSGRPSQKALGFLQGALQVRGGFDYAEPGANSYKDIRDDRGNAGENNVGAQKANGFNGADQAVRGFSLVFRDSGQVDDHGAGTLGMDGIEQLVAQLRGVWPINPANQRHD